MEKKMWMWVIVAALVIAAVAFFMLNNKQAASPVDNSGVQVPAESAQDINPQDTGAAVTPITYAQALIKYADRRIQLDTMCKAIPNNVTYKDNTGIMIDNRSPQTRTVTIGSAFTIKPWGFKIIVLPDVYLKSKTILMDCGQALNVATILIQE